MSHDFPVYTCRFCTRKVITQQYTIVYCICKQLGIQYTKGQLKFLGSLPVEYKEKYPRL
jgi:hypothetical protein